MLIVLIAIAFLALVTYLLRDTIKSVVRHIVLVGSAQDELTESLTMMKRKVQQITRQLSGSDAKDSAGLDEIKDYVKRLSDELDYVSPSTSDEAAAIDSDILVRLQRVEDMLAVCDEPGIISGAVCMELEVALNLIKNRCAIRD